MKKLMNIKKTVLMLLFVGGASICGMHTPKYQSGINTFDSNGNTSLSYALVAPDYTPYEQQKKIYEIRRLLYAGADFSHCEHLFQETPHLEKILNDRHTLSRDEFGALLEKDQGAFLALHQQEQVKQQEQERLKYADRLELKRISHESKQREMEEYGQQEVIRFSLINPGLASVFSTFSAKVDQPKACVSPDPLSFSSSSSSDVRLIDQGLSALRLVAPQAAPSSKATPRLLRPSAVQIQMERAQTGLQDDMFMPTIGLSAQAKPFSPNRSK